jgi:3-oxoacyl-[acyl-carrier protein] reductase
MDLGIKGKWALVCGASKGLGLGCAQALAREGANVVLVARGVEALEASAAALRRNSAVPPSTRIETVAADITTAKGQAKVFAHRTDFDIVVTNAGGPPPGHFKEWGREDWMRAIEANMLAPIEVIKATVDGMVERKFGRIVNITSGAVKSPLATLGLSNGARSGLTGFIAGLARDPKLVSANVIVNNLLPGAFDTDRLRGNMAGAGKKVGKSLEEMMDSRRIAIPARRFGNAEEFGAICAFLCSQHAGYVVGQNILADGGTYPGTF